MSQFDFGNLESPLSGTELINNNLEPWRDALHSGHMGPTRPSYAIEGLHWIDNSSTPWILKVFTGSDDTSLGTIDPATNIYTPAGVSQAAADISYDNTDSGLSSDNVQDAIDEAYGDYDAFANRVSGFATAAQGALAATALQPQAGQLVNTQVFEYAIYNGTTAIIPVDDTIPQNTEGSLIITAPYTMKNSTNKLRVSFEGLASNTAANVITAAIFRDSVADAIAVGAVQVTGSANAIPIVTGPYEFLPAASSITLTVRVGGGGGTSYLNGIQGSRRFGGILKSVLKIEELKS